METKSVKSDSNVLETLHDTKQIAAWHIAYDMNSGLLVKKWPRTYDVMNDDDFITIRHKQKVVALYRYINKTLYAISGTWPGEWIIIQRAIKAHVRDDFKTEGSVHRGL